MVGKGRSAMGAEPQARDMQNKASDSDSGI